MNDSFLQAKSEIVDLLLSARVERTPDTARRLLSEAARAADHWIRVSNVTLAQSLKAQAFAELALLETNFKKRNSYWQKALRSFSEPWDAERADAYATTVVDFVQDNLTNALDAERLRALRDARGLLEMAIKNGPREQKGQLLARKSSVMRQFARFEITKAGRMAVAEGAMRCVTAALAYEKNEQVMIEIASCEWALARYCPTDREYGIHLRRAIEYLSAPDLECSPVAQLALSFIYRSSFRPFHACLIYPVTLKENMHVRQVLRNSFIHAEAATQLSFREYPEEVVRPELQKAAVLLETAISAGYGTARLLCDLAFVRAALGDIGSATSVLSELVSSEGLNWTAIANAVREDRANDLFLESFAIGVAQSAILTRLGTFASRFLQDQQLAESLYRAALKINGSDAVALTNLARFLIRANRNLDEARRLLAHAESVADTRFVWWRHLKAKLEPRTTARPQRWIKRDPSSLKDLRHEFRRIKADDTNVQQRGYVLEALIQRMAEVTFGEALTPYRFDRVGGDESQVDGFFKHFADRYRVECKWENSLTKRPAIVVFHDKLGAAGVSGLFVSMAGFDDSAVAVARERASSKAILLMDGKEVEAVFEGWLDFEAVLSEKRTHFDAKSNPYHRVVTEEWF